MKLSELGEDGVVAALTGGLRVNRRVVLRAGDDCAVVKVGRELQLLKVDCVVEGIHFLGQAEPSWVGWKALCRPISDIAAMGGFPNDALVAIAVRVDQELAWLRGLYKGLARAANVYRVNLVGGETSKSPGPTFISVSLTGSLEAGRFVSRAGGRQNDLLFVTGRLGGSLKGRHLKMRPRVEEARWLVRHFPIHAMMDLSDGLGADLPRLARASGTGFEVDLKKIPLNRRCSLRNAIEDGEDYELLFAIPGRAQEMLVHQWSRAFPKLPLTCIGHLAAPKSYALLGSGYDHFSSKEA
ncbi:MAG: thiamine-phosphate kinase [Chthoniobacterales bacterium]